VTAGDSAADDWFGCAMVLSGETALAGVYHDDVGSSDNQGSPYVVDLAAYPDIVDPTTTAALTPAANGAGWHRSPVTLTLSATDSPGSGVDKTYYHFGSSGAFAVCNPAAKPTVSAQGTTTVQCYSTDKTGNTEATKSVTVRIDSAKPTTNAFKASVNRGKKVKLGYLVGDPVPGCDQATVTLTIYRGKELKKTLKVCATDMAGNAQSMAGFARLTVKLGSIATLLR
jgi:hypothetical protein